MSYYDWKAEIASEDVSDVLSDEELYQKLYNKIQKNYRCDDEDMADEMNAIISIKSIPMSSYLFSCLEDWTEQQGSSIEEVARNAVKHNNKLYWTTGCGYDTIDADLLGGGGDGGAVKEFSEFIQSNKRW